MIAAFSLVQRDPQHRLRVVKPIRAVDLECLPQDWNSAVRGYHRRGRAA